MKRSYTLAALIVPALALLTPAAEKPHASTPAGHSAPAHTAQPTNAPPATQPSAGHAAAARHEAPGAPLFDDLGDYHHPITTRSEKAQRYFNQGLTLVYGFNHAEAIRSFREAARHDPQAPMPWWGVALAYGPNINMPMDAANNPAAWEALQKAKSLAKNGTEKEQAYIDALSKRYAEQPPEDRSSLDKAFADAMGELSRKYPDDLDAATLYAEALMDLSPWEYWTKDGQPKEATKHMLAAIERVLEKLPDHPGANHYYIHAVEAVKPELALASADRLRRLVPGAGHLVHMPAHIYLRLGLYREATLVNELAAAADESYIVQCNAQGFYPAGYYPHNVHFLWYTNAMEGCSRESIRAAEKIVEHGDRHSLAEAQRLRPILLMALVRFGKWDDVLAQPLPPADQLYESAITHHARGLALAAKGKLDEAQKDLDALQKITGKEKEALETPVLPGASLVSIAQHDLAGHLALARGDHGKAVEHLREAVKLEDGLPYMEPPFSYMPMRHGLGKAMLSANQAKEAEQVYREDLKRHPNNGWSLLGLEQSLRKQGKDDLADEVKARFDIAWIRADVQPASSRF